MDANLGTDGSLLPVLAWPGDLSADPVYPSACSQWNALSWSTRMSETTSSPSLVRAAGDETYKGIGIGLHVDLVNAAQDSK